MVDLRDRYTLTFNRESGYGRYDVMLEPKNSVDDAIILEFKVHEEEDGELPQDAYENMDLPLRERRY